MSCRTTDFSLTVRGSYVLAMTQTLSPLPAHLDGLTWNHWAILEDKELAQSEGKSVDAHYWLADLNALSHRTQAAGSFLDFHNTLTPAYPLL